MKIHEEINSLFRFLQEIIRRLNAIQIALGRIETNMQHEVQSMSDVEFKVFSQWGEDGVIQHLIKNIDIKNKIFIEFGVENYQEANTRFLLINNNWSGLVIDGSSKNIETLKKDEIYWRYNIKSEASFITRDNINDIILRNGLGGDIGILSVDIDGNDYWVWESIDVIRPSIIIAEYNSLFGFDASITIPYQENFIRSESHYSWLYYGASICALTDLGKKKGYSLVHGNTNGNNLFFVRNDLLGNLQVIEPKAAYQKAQFRESRNMNGKLSFLAFEDSQKLILDMPVYDTRTDSMKKLAEVL